MTDINSIDIEAIGQYDIDSEILNHDWYSSCFQCISPLDPGSERKTEVKLNSESSYERALVLAKQLIGCTIFSINLGKVNSNKMWNV